MVREEEQIRIILVRPGIGFFASFIQVLGELHYCANNNILPYVLFGSNWLYWHDDGWNDARNGWEYYFDQLSDLDIEKLLGKEEEVLLRCNIFDFQGDRRISDQHAMQSEPGSPSGHLVEIPSGTVVKNTWPEVDAGKRHFNEPLRSDFSRLIIKHIRIKDMYTKCADKFFRENLGGKPFIGVHCRGPEHNGEIGGWHCFARADEELYFKEVDLYLSGRPECRVFLATDTASTVSKFQERYGDKLVYRYATRSSTGSSPHLEKGGPKVGEEVLLDALILSKSDFLLHGISNVAFAVLCLNEQLEHLDIYDRYRLQLRAKYLWQNPVAGPFRITGNLMRRLRLRMLESLS